MATSNTTPIVIPQPIAAQATSENINAIPNGATGTNRASFQEGFPAITRMPVIENPLTTQVSGLPPKQQDFNGLFNAVSQHNFFAQNGGLYSFNQAVSDAIGGYPQGALLWVIDGGKPMAVYSLIENNTFNFLTNPEYLDGVHWAFIDTGLPTGMIIAWAANDVPDGYLICNGAAISRTTYARLFSVIGTAWGEGDGKTTFNVPDARDRTMWMNIYTFVGFSEQGALPKISGEVSPMRSVNTTQVHTGCFANSISGGYRPNIDVGARGVSNDEWNTKVVFDAALSSPTYNRSDHLVVPANITILFCIKY